MSLPSPHLDNRKFQDIVDEVKRQIGRRCPEWTDHNVSDPGVTMIELFAWMTEMSLYQMNQVPEKNYVKFLEMVGISLEPPAPAVTELRFRLSRSIEDVDGEEAFERMLPARRTVAATIRTESEEAVEFLTDRNLYLVRPKLAYVLAIPDSGSEVSDTEMPASGREFTVREKNNKEGFPIFSPTPRNGDALYVGFENDVSSNVVELEAGCVFNAATGLDEDYPAQRWEVWNGTEARWDTLEILEDTSFGFQRGPGQWEAGTDGVERRGLLLGRIAMALPAGMLPRRVGGKKGYWVRCVYDTTLPPRGPEGNRKTPAPYEKPPKFRSLLARTVGGTAAASNCATITYKELGQSDGTPGQVFAVGQAPILPLRVGEHILVGELGKPYSEWEKWEAVEDFADSGPEDRHFVCDTYRGEIYFGPSVMQPDGKPRQHGQIPMPTGATIALSAFRFGGGPQGNIAREQVSVLKSALPYIAEVFNPSAAVGGRMQETLERAKLRARSELRQQRRAVTAEDYESLAREASSGVGRARCLQPRAVHSAGREGENIRPGVVRVLLVPALDAAVTVPRPADLRVPAKIQQDVEKYLDERRLLTSVLEIAEPDYLYVSTDITLFADPKYDPDDVRQAVRARLNAFLHPLTGGPNGDGWPFRRKLTLADIYAQIQQAQGVAFLTDAKIYTSGLVNPKEGLFAQETLVSNAAGVVLNENQLLTTREHRIRVRQMWEMGTAQEDV